MTLSLFDALPDSGPVKESLGSGAAILRGFALSQESDLVKALSAIAAASPFRHMITPGGFRMSVAMTNCGDLGWITDSKGYRYASSDPETNRAWPSMPICFRELATAAAREAGFDDFTPDACLINRYEPGASLSLHQDKDEHDYRQPIVSVSLGLPATFLFGGDRRSDKITRIPVVHGDVVVWGGSSRLRYHGVLRLKDGVHPLMGPFRFNLTLRKAA